MKILVINCGSSTLKYQLIDLENGKDTVLCKGNFERIGESSSFFTHKNQKEEIVISVGLRDHLVAVEKMLELLTDKKVGAIETLDCIDAVGHRAVHGGNKYTSATLITPKVIKDFEDMAYLAPLHNPANALGVRAIEAKLPNVPQVLVFDTAFHSTLPREAYLYAIPYEDYTKNNIRRYGFHGTSYSYVSKVAAEMLSKDLKDLKIVACHLGNGASVTAIQGGKSVETSMGFTPIEGIIMGTRCGDIDVGAVDALARAHNFDLPQVLSYLNKTCGLKGMSGIGSDMRDILAALDSKDKAIVERAQTTLDAFAHRLIKYIGSYAAVMGGMDAIIFTGGVGTWGNETREKIVDRLEFLGAKIDKTLNDKFNGKQYNITAKGAKVQTLVIPTNEELEIARETACLVEKA